MDILKNKISWLIGHRNFNLNWLGFDYPPYNTITIKKQHAQKSKSFHGDKQKITTESISVSGSGEFLVTIESNILLTIILKLS